MNSAVVLNMPPVCRNPDRVKLIFDMDCKHYHKYVHLDFTETRELTEAFIYEVMDEARRRNLEIYSVSSNGKLQNGIVSKAYKHYLRDL